MIQRELQGRSVPCLTLSPPLLRAGAVQSDRTAAVGAVMEALRTRGGVLSRWYGEMFPVVTAFGDEPAFLLERGAYTLLGVKGVQRVFV